MTSLAPIHPLPPVRVSTSPFKWLGNLWGAIEGIALIGLVLVFERFATVDLASLPVHPLFLVVALLAAQHGTFWGVFTALGAIGATDYFGLQPERSIDQPYVDYMTALWAMPLMLLVVALMIGIVTDRIRRELTLSKSALSSAEQERDLIAGRYEALADRAKKLERLAAGFEAKSGRRVRGM